MSSPALDIISFYILLQRIPKKPHSSVEFFLVSGIHIGIIHSVSKSLLGYTLGKFFWV